MKLFSNRKLLVASVVALIISATTFAYIFLYNGIRFIEKEVTYPEVSEYQIFEMLEGKSISIPFKADSHYIQSINVLLINLNPEETGELSARLLDEKGEAIYSDSKPLHYIPAGEFFPIKIHKRVAKNATYYIELSQTGAALAPYLLYCDENQVTNGVKQLVDVTYMNEASNWERTGIMLIVLVGLMFAVISFAGIDMTDVSKKMLTKCFLGIMLLIQFLMMMPSFVYRFDYVNLDQSWRYALNVLAHKGYRIGSDAFFTYGPIGFICYLMNLDNNGITFYFGMAILIIVVLINAYFLYKVWKLVSENKISIISAILSVFAFVFAYTKSEWDNYMLYTLVLGVVIAFYAREEGESHKGYINKSRIFVIVAINFLFTVMSLSKFSTFTSALAFIILFTIFDFFFNRKLEGIWYFLPACGASVIGYLIYNPSLKDLFRYLKGIFKISDGWMISSQWNSCLDERETLTLIIIMFLYVVLIVGAIIYNYKSSHIIISLSASMFLLYKYATTRHGLACGLWLFAMLYSAAILSFDFRVVSLGNFKDLKTQNKNRVIGVLVSLCFVITASLSVNSLHETTGHIVSQVKEKLSDIGKLGDSSVTEMAIANGTLSEELLNRVGEESVCVYSYRQAIGATNPSLNLKIFPSIQGVLTIVPMMEQQNTYFFNSEDAPTYVIVYDETIDDRIDFLDSPYTWDGLKSNYQVDSIYDGITLLKKVRTDAPKDDITEKYTLIGTEIYNKDAVIEVPSEASYVTVSLNFNLKGKLKKFFYHVYVTDMNVSYEDGRNLSGRAIIPTLEEGFETIYFPQNPNEMVDSFGYVDDSVTENGPRMLSFSFSGRGLEDLADEIEVTWYK